MIDEFLNGHLKGQPLWVDMKRLEALKVEQLGPQTNAIAPAKK